MRNNIFNSTFENMLRVLLLLNVLNTPVNVDRIAALDFISIYGKKCNVLDKNLHGDNEFTFSEFSNKRLKITEAVKLSVRNDFVNVQQTPDGFLYSINGRGKTIVDGIKSPYSRAYIIGAKIVCRRFSDYSDARILRYISDKSTQAKEILK